ncbi:MAG: YHS domain-containing (seleno)protein, partial [Aurantibacter sp.]
MKTINFILLAVILTGSNISFAQGVNVDKNNLANNGYDVVSYFTTNSAQRGSKEFSVDHSEATYYFVNEENLKAFTASPENYLPQFGGFCAFGMGKM